MSAPRTFWCLFREAPFRPLFANGVGFAVPRRDESRPLWLFRSEAEAVALRRHLRHDAGGHVFVAKRSQLRERLLSNDPATT